MSFKINTSIIKNEEVREALESISKVATRQRLGIKRWDNVIDRYKFSGTVTIPIKLGKRIRSFSDPFYFVFEKVNDHESLRIRTVDGEQWSSGDVYGFFGLHNFGDFTLDKPILIVEGISDWAAVNEYYKYTVASLSAWLGYRQLFFINGLSRLTFIGWDADATGNTNTKKSLTKLEGLGSIVKRFTPAEKDWGNMIESDFGKTLLHKQMMGFLEMINKLKNN